MAVIRRQQVKQVKQGRYQMHQQRSIHGLSHSPPKAEPDRSKAVPASLLSLASKPASQQSTPNRGLLWALARRDISAHRLVWLRIKVSLILTAPSIIFFFKNYLNNTFLGYQFDV